MANAPTSPNATRAREPEFLAMIQHQRDVTEVETGIRPVAFLDVTGHGWRQELRKQLKLKPDS